MHVCVHIMCRVIAGFHHGLVINKCVCVDHRIVAKISCECGQAKVETGSNTHVFTRKRGLVTKSKISWSCVIAFIVSIFPFPSFVACYDDVMSPHSWTVVAVTSLWILLIVWQLEFNDCWFKLASYAIVRLSGIHSTSFPLYWLHGKFWCLQSWS